MKAAVSMDMMILVRLPLINIAVSFGRDFELFLMATSQMNPHGADAHLDQDQVCTRNERLYGGPGLGAGTV